MLKLYKYSKYESKKKKKIKKNNPIIENNPIIKYVGANSWPFQRDHVETWAWAKDVFSPEECQKIIKIGNNLKPQLGKIIGKNGQEICKKNVRKSLTSWISPNPDTEWIYIKLQQIVEEMNKKFFKLHLTGINESLQFTKYQAPDGHYHTHIDKMYNGYIRKLSLTIQLTDPSKYEGGELELFQQDKPLVVRKEQGTAIFFPSYVLHGVKPVTKGERCSLVGWFTGDPFK